MAVFEMKAWPREERGSRACRRLRRQALVPAILYGRHKPNVLLAMREADLHAMLEEHAFIVRLMWDGQEESAQLKELQVDQMGDQILHADFARISLAEKVRVSAAIQVRGEAPGVALGGALEMQLHEIEVECLPGAIPDALFADVSGLGIGDVLRVQDMSFPPEVTPVAEPQTVILGVVPPTEVPEEEAAEEILAEPELIRREAEEAEEAQEEPGEAQGKTEAGGH